MDINHVHPTFLETPENIEMTPPHEERKESPTYRKSHEFLVIKQDTPCYVCGVKQSTLHDPIANKLGSKQMETHHWPIEWSLQNAVDVNKVHRVFPEVIDEGTLHAFIDSPRNLLVLCDLCHRSTVRGVHHLLAQDFAVMPFLLDSYVLLSDRDHAALAEKHDEEVLKGTITPGD